MDDLVCILDALALVSNKGRVWWRDGREEGERCVCWEGSHSRPACSPSAPLRPHSPAAVSRCLPSSEMDKWRVSEFPLIYLAGSTFWTFALVGPGNTGTSGCVIKPTSSPVSSLLNHPPGCGGHGFLVGWKSPPSPNSDMETDHPDDRTPSPYSDKDSGPLWVETPLVRSRHISDRLGLDAYLKMEVKQRSSSFR